MRQVVGGGRNSWYLRTCLSKPLTEGPRFAAYRPCVELRLVCIDGTRKRMPMPADRETLEAFPPLYGAHAAIQVEAISFQESSRSRGDRSGKLGRSLAVM